MSGFASKLINTLFKGKASARPAAMRRRAALSLEPLELRAVLSTVVPTTAADDVVVDGPVITGQDFNSARHGAGAGGGMGGGKVSMQDFHFTRPMSTASHHSGGVNVLLGDGSVRFISDTVSLPPSGGTIVYTGLDQAQAGAHGSGGGAGKVSMQDFGVGLLEDVDPVDIIVSASGAPGGHVKVFDGARGAELGSFFAFPGFNGGVRVATASPSVGFSGGVTVAAGDIGGDADVGGSGHGTHVAGTIGAVPPAVGGAGTPNGHVKVFDGIRSADSGIDYSHPDLYLNVWINQALESIIDDIAADVANHR